MKRTFLFSSWTPVWVVALSICLALGACGGEPTPTPEPSTPPLPQAMDPTLSEPPAGYKLYQSPYWAALYYPETWVQVYDEQSGDILLATESFGLYSPTVPEAVFQIWPIEQGDSLAALEQALESALEGDLNTQLDVDEGSRTVRLVEEPKVITINGQEAATAAISFPRIETDFDWDSSETTSTEAGLLLEWVTVVKGPDRRAVVLAYCDAGRQDEYRPVFDAMLNSLILRQGLPDPVIGDSGAVLPAGYVPYLDEQKGVGLSHPSTWTAEWGGNELFVAPPGEPWQEQRFGRLEVILIDDLDDLAMGDPGDTPDQVLRWFVSMVGYTSSTFHDAVLVTDVVTAERHGQGIARALLSGTVDGEPALGIMTVIQQGRRAALVLAYVRNEAELPELVRIMDTVALTEPVRAAPIPLAPGRVYTGTLQAGRKVNYTLSCTADVSVAVILKTWTMDASVTIADARGVEVGSEVAYVSQDSVEPSVVLVAAEEEGSCGVTVNDFQNSDLFTYTLQVVEASPGAPAVVQIVDGELLAGQEAEHTFEAVSGEPFVVAIHPAAGECRYGGLEILDELGEERAGSGFSTVACGGTFDQPAKALYFVPIKAGSYTVRIEEAQGQPMRYRLYILQVD